MRERDESSAPPATTSKSCVVLASSTASPWMALNASLMVVSRRSQNVTKYSWGTVLSMWPNAGDVKVDFELAQGGSLAKSEGQRGETERPLLDGPEKVSCSSLRLRLRALLSPRYAYGTMRRP